VPPRLSRGGGTSSGMSGAGSGCRRRHRRSSSAWPMRNHVFHLIALFGVVSARSRFRGRCWRPAGERDMIETRHGSSPRRVCGSVPEEAS
jgi:hypothetical protein